MKQPIYEDVLIILKGPKKCENAHSDLVQALQDHFVYTAKLSHDWLLQLLRTCQGWNEDEYLQKLEEESERYMKGQNLEGI